MSHKNRQELRKVRQIRVRKNIFGEPERPRLAVYRSLKHISAQIIDDRTGNTLASASSMEKSLEAVGNAEGATKIGEALAKRALEAGVTKVVLDRGGFKYHGRVSALADGARKGGLEF